MLTVLARESHEQFLVMSLDRDEETLLAQKANAVALKLDRRAMAQLPGDLAFTLIADVVHQGRDARQLMRELARGLLRRKTARILFRYEARREHAGAPALVRHQRGEEGNVVANAVDDEAVERAGLSLYRGEAARPMRHELGDHRVIMDRDVAALGDARIVAHGDPVSALLARRPIFDEPAD